MIFSTNSGGMPRNAEMLPFIKSEEIARYRTVRNGTAFSWQGEIECYEVDCDKEPVETWNGTIYFRKFSLAMDKDLFFYFGYGAGDSSSFDYGVFTLSNELKLHLGLTLDPQKEGA